MNTHLHNSRTGSRFSRAIFSALILLVILDYAATAQSLVIAEIEHVYPRELKSDGFVLKNDQVVYVEAVGPMARRNTNGLANAWILDARTREVVWEFDAADTQDRNSRVREVSDAVSLPAGTYEVYYASFPYSYDNWEGDEWEGYWDDFRIGGLGEIIRDVLDDIFNDRRDRSYYDWDDRFGREARNFGITVTCSGDGYNEYDRARLNREFENMTVVALTTIEDDAYVQQGFELTRSMEIEVYAVGELQRYEAFDYGWILNADTRDRVWEMTYSDTEHGGGADKNRVANEIISLPAGRYVAYFVTDGSHSAEEWNSAPPYDPFIWGMTLLVEDQADLASVEQYDDNSHSRENAIVSLTRMMGEDLEREGFTLRTPMDVRIYAIGEGRDGNMFDYGWIDRADTYERVWEMEYEETDHAGGGDKNRHYDGIIFLEAGSYVVSFQTDYGHNYGDWNTDAPYDRESYGITILPVGDDVGADDFSAYDEAHDASILAQLIRMRDDVYRREDFTLDRQTEVRIYALGEGSSGDMYDYGWIEDSDGDVVWEMTYRETEHAGGASKNRVANTTILLDAGGYTVFYETDGSHAFDDWNDDPPVDSFHWGITVRVVNRR